MEGQLVNHIAARDSRHAHDIVAAYVLCNGAAIIEEDDRCTVLASGFSVNNNNSMIAVITWGGNL